MPASDRVPGLRSCLYECTVAHRRLAPKRHEFVYRIFLFWLDLDELAAVADRVPIFSTNDANLYSFRDDDYFSLGQPTLRDNAVAFARANGVSQAPARVCALTLPRFLGYTFNPVSVLYFYDADDVPYASVVQVGNTFRELKPYVVPRAAEAGRFHARVTKHFYVSPFSDLDLAFDFRFEAPGERLGIWIDDYRGAEKMLVSSLTGTRTELTTGNLLALTAKYPFITLKVIGLIHWQALRLWFKRLPFHRKEANPDLQRGVFNPHESLK